MVKSLALKSAGPVGLVPTRKAGIKYKKPRDRLRAWRAKTSPTKTAVKGAPDGRISSEITPEMIEAGIKALQRRGFGNDCDSINSLQSAVSAVFVAMVESCHQARLGLGNG